MSTAQRICVGDHRLITMWLWPVLAGLLCAAGATRAVDQPEPPNKYSTEYLMQLATQMHQQQERRVRSGAAQGPPPVRRKVADKSPPSVDKLDTYADKGMLDRDPDDLEDGSPPVIKNVNLDTFNAGRDVIIPASVEEEDSPPVIKVNLETFDPDKKVIIPDTVEEDIINDYKKPASKPSTAKDVVVRVPLRFELTSSYSLAELNQTLEKYTTLGMVVCNSTETNRRLKDTNFTGLCATKGGCFKQARALVESDGTTILQYHMGCIQLEDYQPFDRPLSCLVLAHNTNTTEMACCHNAHFCAQQLTVFEPLAYVDYMERTQVAEGKRGRMVFLWIIMLLALFLPAGAIVFCVRWRQISKLYKYKFKSDDLYTKETMLTDAGSYDPSYDMSHSGSGAGMPGLAPRTVSRQIELVGEQPIGSGRYGQVWLGNWKGEQVAVKIFPLYEEASWLRELEIYETKMLRHPYVLGFRASDNKDTGLRTELWLVTDYHANGALFDYLRAEVLSLERAVHFVQCISSGLAFLHAEITGTQCKPGIAHRDIKSKNILVKSDHTLCIGDLGMAVRYSNGVLDMPMGNRVGTRRYLAPELLTDTINTQHFDAFRRADIYAFALVIWEICSRVQYDENVPVPAYKAPYHDFVGADPSQEEVRRCVCARPARRPVIMQSWLANPVSCGLCNLAVECWRHQPHARLTAYRVKCTADKLMAQLKQSNLESLDVTESTTEC